MIHNYIKIKTSFTAQHSWPDCNLPNVDYLKHEHRHTFHVSVVWEISHLDRQLEFITQKSKVDAYINHHWRDQYLPGISCEMMCNALIKRFNCHSVEVSEDGEFSAVAVLSIPSGAKK